VGRAFLMERGSTLRKARDDRDQKAAQLEDKKEKKKVDTAAKRELKKRQKETAQNAPGAKKRKCDPWGGRLRFGTPTRQPWPAIVCFPALSGIAGGWTE
jgi:hypothetical protein